MRYVYANSTPKNWGRKPANLTQGVSESAYGLALCGRMTKALKGWKTCTSPNIWAQCQPSAAHRSLRSVHFLCVANRRATKRIRPIRPLQHRPHTCTRRGAEDATKSNCRNCRKYQRLILHTAHTGFRTPLVFTCAGVRATNHRKEKNTSVPPCPRDSRSLSNALTTRAEPSCHLETSVRLRSS